MKTLGSVLSTYLEDTERMLDENESAARARAGKRTVHTLVSEELSPAFAAELPDDFTFRDYAAFDHTTIEKAKRRLQLCAKCPPHGGECASVYEQDRGRAPCWDRDGLFRMDWCVRWSGYLVREKLQRIGVGERLLGCRLGTFTATTQLQTEALAQCKGYAKSFRRGQTRSNLVIYGPSYGVGKTHLAIGVVAQLLADHRLRNAQFHYVPEFLERIRRSYDDPSQRHILDKACRTDLLVLDDLAAQRTTDWVKEQLNLIANARWSNALPTIITTNVSQEEQEKVLGPRATSRLFGDHGKAIVDGERDQRIVQDEEPPKRNG